MSFPHKIVSHGPLLPVTPGAIPKGYEKEIMFLKNVNNVRAGLYVAIKNDFNTVEKGQSVRGIVAGLNSQNSMTPGVMTKFEPVEAGNHETIVEIDADQAVAV